MKRVLGILSFFLGIIFITFILFYTGQEHTLIIDNKYKEKNESKNIVFKIEGEKAKKISKNKKAILELKGLKHKFEIEIDGENFYGEINFSLNRGSEIMVENFVAKKEEWIKSIPQY
ncbi:DUF6672 family protein [uncultured Cetobacterium sp.]|uniref:DUF6672 family protein n=1 Tax=uncultured Cetobacterium sp. TaxID=527638 RepID=UPI002635D320|nr:DUF6672 family protein [uncultured Cetobacterium sp.]